MGKAGGNADNLCLSFLSNRGILVKAAMHKNAPPFTMA